MSDIPWWRGATIYQIYPRSFADSNGDGIGDLAGITARLDHVARFGAEAVWLSPFFKSPMRDFGYDVSDYCDVDPIFGTLADFDALVARAHSLGLKVLIDQVYAHSSDQHPWFADSRSARTGPRADWYVWADAKPDGSPPNNWQAVFGGPCWTWDARRRQYYMHNFLPGQPQLNVHNPDVQDALLDVARFWLDRGVDGFRLDALNFTMHDPLLRDNPPAPDDGKVRTRPFDFQLHVNNQSHGDIPAFIRRIRALLDRYDACFTVAEVGGVEAPREMKAYTHGPHHLDSAYGFDFLYAPRLTAALVEEAIGQWPDAPDTGWPSWAFSNHDAPRWISRWADAADPLGYARMVWLLFVCLRGNIIVWQGEELGLTQVDIPFEQLQDPEAIANWPLTLSRDGTRTPMPWQDDALHCGFSSGTPWLPLGADHPPLSVNRQEADPDALLHWARRMIAFRNAHPALRRGRMEIIRAEGDLLLFARELDGVRLLCMFNLGDTELPVPSDVRGATLLADTGGAGPERLPPYSGCVLHPAA